MTDKKFLPYNLVQFNNIVVLTNQTEASAGSPIVSQNIGGTNGGVLTQLSLGYNAAFQKNAYLKLQITGISIQPSGFQAVSQTFNTFNYVASGDQWVLPPNAILNIYAYNQGAGSTPELFDVIATVKQWLS
jgi:hypothetical protein